MGNTYTRAVVILALAGLVIASAATLMAAPPTDFSRKAGTREVTRPQPYRPYLPCPWPPCAAPCVLGAEPQVICRSADGSVNATTFFCCCCGGGNGNTFKPL